jgi:hypothetical protein
MFKSRGLYTYVLNNNLKSLGLLAGFLLVAQLMFAAIWAATGIFIFRIEGKADYLAKVIELTWHHSASGGVAGLGLPCLPLLQDHIARHDRVAPSQPFSRTPVVQHR